MRELRQAVEAEFAGDPARLAVARRHVELASGTGPAAVGALRELGQLIAASRAGPDSRQVRHELVERIAVKVTVIAEARARRRLIEERSGSAPGVDEDGRGVRHGSG